MWFLYKQKQNGIQGRWLSRIDEIFESTHVYSVAYHTQRIHPYICSERNKKKAELTFEIYNETVAHNIFIHRQRLVCIQYIVFS